MCQSVSMTVSELVSMHQCEREKEADSNPQADGTRCKTKRACVNREEQRTTCHRHACLLHLIQLEKEISYRYLKFFGDLLLSLLLWQNGQAQPCRQRRGGRLHGSVLQYVRTKLDSVKKNVLYMHTHVCIVREREYDLRLERQKTSTIYRIVVIVCLLAFQVFSEAFTLFASSKKLGYTQ